MDLHLHIFKRITKDDIQAYELLFKEYYGFLCSYAFGLTNEKHIAEDIVEEFFAHLWKYRKVITITKSVRSYFISSIHNRCLNYLQREKGKFLSLQNITDLIGKEDSVGEQFLLTQPPTILINELENKLAKAIENLPEECRKIFLLSRNNNMSYNEISSRLNISVNTVKTQIKIALRKLREHLKEYLPE